MAWFDCGHAMPCQFHLCQDVARCPVPNQRSTDSKPGYAVCVCVVYIALLRGGIAFDFIECLE